MAINFPDPTVTQTFTDDNQKTWQWDTATSSWKALLPQVYSQSYVDTAINSLQTQIDGIDIDQHLNTDSAGNNQILSWDGSEYLWVDPTSGPAGADGADGLSAYEVAVSEGYPDSAGAWLDSLVGPAGADGAPGANGTNGTNGADGADGLSAYEVAVSEGYPDSAGAWLDSLVGPAGADGADGENGTNGTDGADGLSAYEVAVSEGYPDSAGAWLDSLVGPAGADGEDGTTADIDTHLNVGTASDGQVLSWDSAGDEYVWIDQTGGSSSYSDDSVNSLLNVNSAGDGQVLSWNDSAGEYVWIDQMGGGSSYSDNNVNSLLNVGSSGDGQVLSWDGNSQQYTWTDNLQTRTDVDTSSITITTPNPSLSKDLPSGGYHLGYIEGFKTYSLLKINVSHSNLWVTIYTDSTSMGNDASRSHTVDPDPGSGVIAEVISSSSDQDLIMTPTTIGFNMDGTPNNNIYLKIVNLGGTSLGGDYSVTLTILRMEK